MNGTLDESSSSYVSSFWESGYAIVRDVFTPDEIKRLRRNAYESVGHRGDLLSNPSLREVVVDERVVGIATRVLGGTPVYFGDSTCLLGGFSHGYHKDNADRDDENAPDWQGRYSLMRFGIYLQDHHSHSGGLNVRHRSHMAISTNSGRNVYLRTREGDVAIWNLRTTHSGTGRLLRLRRDIHVSPALAYRLPRWLFEPIQRERVALFVSFGLDNEHLARYLTYLKTRTYMVSTWRNSNYGQDVQQVLEGKSLLVRDMQSEIKHERDIGINEQHAPIPY